MTVINNVNTIECGMYKKQCAFNIGEEGSQIGYNVGRIKINLQGMTCTQDGEELKWHYKGEDWTGTQDWSWICE